MTKYFFLILSLLFIIPIVSAAELRNPGDVSGSGVYRLYNFTNITSSKFCLPDNTNCITAWSQINGSGSGGPGTIITIQSTDSYITVVNGTLVNISANLTTFDARYALLSFVQNLATNISSVNASHHSINAALGVNITNVNNSLISVSGAIGSNVSSVNSSLSSRINSVSTNVSSINSSLTSAIGSVGSNVSSVNGSLSSVASALGANITSVNSSINTVLAQIGANITADNITFVEVNGTTTKTINLYKNNVLVLSASWTDISGNASSITGTGNINQIAKFASTTDVANSSIYESAGFVGINNVNPAVELDIGGTSSTDSRTDIILRTNVSTEFLRMAFFDSGTIGSPLFRIDPTPLGNNATAIDFFRNVNTTGATTINVMVGNGTTSTNARLSGNGNSYVNVFAGSFGVGDSSPAALFVVGSGDLFRVNSTGHVQAISGAATIPSYTFVSDLDTGIYNPQNGIVVIVSNGTAELNVTSTGAYSDAFWQRGVQVIDNSTVFAGDVSGNVSNLQLGTGVVGATELAATTVSAASYGNRTHVPTYTVDADGRLTAASDVAISIPFSAIQNQVNSLCPFGTHAAGMNGSPELTIYCTPDSGNVTGIIGRNRIPYAINSTHISDSIITYNVTTGFVGVNKSNPTTLFYVDGSSTFNGNIFTNVTSCSQALETDSNGAIICGTDATGSTDLSGLGANVTMNNITFIEVNGSTTKTIYLYKNGTQALSASFTDLTGGGGGNSSGIGNASRGYILYSIDANTYNNTVLWYNETNGQTVFTAGSASVPSIISTADIDTGIYFTSGETLIAANGVFRAKVNSNGIAVSDGGLTAPGFHFNTDANNGMRLIRLDNIGLVAGGTDALDINASDVYAERNVTVFGNLTVNANTTTNRLFIGTRSSWTFPDLATVNATTGELIPTRVADNSTRISCNNITGLAGLDSDFCTDSTGSTDLAEVGANISSVNSSLHVIAGRLGVNITNVNLSLGQVNSSLTSAIGLVNTNVSTVNSTHHTIAGAIGSNVSSVNSSLRTIIGAIGTNVTYNNVTFIEVNTSGATETFNLYKNNVLAMSASWTDDTGAGSSGGNASIITNTTSGYIAYIHNGTMLNQSSLWFDEQSGRVVVRASGAPTPMLVGSDDADTGFYFNLTEVSVAVNGVFKAKVNTNGIAVVSGSTSAPGYHFNSDPDNGLMLIASNDVGLVAGGTVGIEVNNTLAQINRNLTVIGKLNSPTTDEISSNLTSVYNDLVFTNATANSANTSIGYLNSTKAATGSCGTGNAVVQNTSSTGVQCLTLPTSSGSPGGSASTLQFKNSTSSFDGNSNVTIDETNGNLVLNSEVDVKYLRFDNVSAPPNPTSEDRVILYGSNKTGQPGVWYTSNASAQPYRLMPMIDMSYMTYCYAQASTTLTCIGTTTTLSGTSTGTGTQDDINTFGRIFYLNTSAGTQSASALAAASSQVYTKNGVDFATTFCFPQSSYGSGSTGTIFWLGFSSMSTKNLTAQDTPANQNAFGFAYSTNASNTNFMLRTQTATSETETDTGVPFTAGDCYYGAVYGEKNGDALYYYMRDLNTTVEGYGYTKSNLPTSTSALIWNVAIKTLSANARYVGVKNWRLYYRP